MIVYNTFDTAINVNCMAMQTLHSQNLQHSFHQTGFTERGYERALRVGLDCIDAICDKTYIWIEATKHRAYPTYSTRTRSREFKGKRLRLFVAQSQEWVVVTRLRLQNRTFDVEVGSVAMAHDDGDVMVLLLCFLGYASDKPPINFYIYMTLSQWLL
ncbi:unnamed protein product [Sphenostylis stenocarpa]|uniref:Uncharacterized protein n=1 Tax=Sphenostylis stenocarpa TaxID=92480 RepID=A0AA86RZ78_9FABA|nr:unnamed protein product [Sphenostylis stenocarpa]